MKKRGQLTIFIIAAVVIIGLALLLFAMQRGLIKQKLSSEAESVYNLVQRCLEQTGREGIYAISLQGGLLSTANSVY